MTVFVLLFHDRFFDCNIGKSCIIHDKHNTGWKQSVGASFVLRHAYCHDYHSYCTSQVSFKHKFNSQLSFFVNNNLVDNKCWPHSREPFLISFSWLTQNLHYCSLTWHNYFGTSRHMIRRATLNICASLQPPILGSEKAQGRKLYHNSFECLQKVLEHPQKSLWYQWMEKF